MGTLRTVTSIIQFLGVLRCLSVPTLLLLGVITIVRRRRKPEEVILEVPAPLPVTRITRPSVDIPTDPHAAFAQAEIYINRGERAQAVAAFLAAYRYGPPELRRKALEALEALGEVEIF